MRIALVALHFAEYSARLALALAAEHEVQLHLSELNAANELSADLAGALGRAVDVRLHPHPARKYAALHGLLIAGALRRFRPDVLHMQEAAEWTALAARIAGPRVPLVWTVHDAVPHSGADQGTRRRTAWAGDRLRRSADAAIVHGAVIASELLRAVPALDGRIHVVPHGTLGAPYPEIDRHPGQFLFFGRIERYKGLAVLIEASAELARRGVDHRLVVAGRGNDLNPHRAALAAMPWVTLDERFVAPEAVERLFAASAAAVMPYLDASQSGVAAYAFGTHTPVIASAVGALPDVILDGVNGLLVPPGDSGALAEAMERMVAEAGLQEALATGARESATTALSWAAIARQTAGVYAEAAGG